MSDTTLKIGIEKMIIHAAIGWNEDELKTEQTFSVSLHVWHQPLFDGSYADYELLAKIISYEFSPGRKLLESMNQNIIHQTNTYIPFAHKITCRIEKLNLPLTKLQIGSAVVETVWEKEPEV